MVVAGPGTGKTELLSVRVANILRKTDTLPENILCLTFTESGQAAMRERLVGIIGKDAYKVAIHTFHSFGSEIMSQQREYFYRNALFEPADDLKQYEVLRGIFETLEFGHPLASTMNGEYTYLNDARRVISELKRSSALTSDELLAVIQQSETSLDSIERIVIPILSERVAASTGDKLSDALVLLHDHTDSVETLYGVPPLARIITDSLEAMLADTESIHPTKPISAWKAQWLERNDAKELVFKDRKRLVKLKALSFIYYEYLRQMEARGLFDYDDMIMQVVHAMEVHDDLKFNLQEKYLYIMVDEFQDTNALQYAWLRLLAGDTGALFAVGDDDQSIYAWRGARPENMVDFEREYRVERVVKLEQNYRSTSRILKAANAVIANNPHVFEKQLWSEMGHGDEIRVIRCRNEDAECERIAMEILTEHLRTERPYSDFAILYRGNYQAKLMELKLQHHQIPYRLSGGTSFFARQEVKDLMSYFRLLVNPDDDNAFLRVINVPRREIGSTTLEKLGNYATERKISMYAACDELGLSEHLDNRYTERLSRFKRYMDKIRELCAGNDPIGAIRSMIMDIDYENWLRQNASSDKVAEARMGNVWFLVEALKNTLDKDEDGDKAIEDAIGKLVLRDMLERQQEEARRQAEAQAREQQLANTPGSGS